MDSDREHKVGNIEVVFEDQWIIVVNKPKGLITIPSPKRESRTLTSILNENINTSHLYPCHRLDRETSGLIIYAKGKSVQQKMMQEFKERRVKKTYLAFVQGNLSKRQGIIKSRVSGQSALTQYELMQNKKGFSVVKINPLTGRKNQIRIHFKHIGHPILGEDRFAFRKDFSIKAKRLCLHAQGLKFLHPVSRKEISLNSDLPQDMLEFLERH